MSRTDLSLPEEPAEFGYGSVWLVGAGTDDPYEISPLAGYALNTADAVIHDPDVSPQLLDLVRPPRYREAAEPSRAIKRSIKLALDGWRVLLLVEGNAIERAIEDTITVPEHRIVPTGNWPLIGKAPTGLSLIRKPMSVGRIGSGSLVVLIATRRSDATTKTGLRQAPLSFSMSGLAG